MSQRKRGESHSSRGNYGNYSSKNRDESLNSRGRNDDHHIHRGNSSNSNRGKYKRHSSTNRNENLYHGGKAEINFSRDKKDEVYCQRYSETQNRNANYGFTHVQEIRHLRKYSSNENISQKWKQSNSNINQSESNSLNYNLRKKSQQKTKHDNVFQNNMPSTSRCKTSDNSMENQNQQSKQKGRRKRNQNHKSHATSENNFSKYVRNNKRYSNLTIRQGSLTNLLTFARTFSERLFNSNDFNEEENNIHDFLLYTEKENNENTLKYQNSKEQQISLPTKPDIIKSDDDKSDISDSESDDSSYSTNSFDKLDDAESEFDDASSIISNKSITIKPESYIGVYWDIENCPVPNKKLASDIVKKVRNKFYSKCTEAEFIVSCDIRNINNTIVTDLNDAQVTVVHVDCLNKNAADSKLKIYLRRFIENYKHPNSRIVLISGDCDFVPDLHDLRYRHKIKVIILHNSTAKKNLRDVANIAEEFGEFCKDLPDIQKFEKKVIIQNLPRDKKPDIIRTLLINLLKAYKYNYLKMNKGNAEIGFDEAKVMKKALSKLNESCIFGNRISAMEICENKSSTKIQEKSEIKEKPKQAEIKEKQKQIENTNKMQNETENSKTKPDKSSESSNSKEISITLQVDEPRNKSFWQNFFQEILSKISFKLQIINDQHKLIILVFESLNKSKKALKLINKHKLKDTESPKILNIIANEKDLKLDDNTEIITKTLKLIDSRLNQCLREYAENKQIFSTEQEAALLSLPNINASECRKVTQNRLKIMNEQKTEFMNYIKNQREKISGFCNFSKDVCAKMIDKVKRELEQECQLFLSGNPAYAKKSSILNVLEKNNICVLHIENHTYDNSEIGQYLLQTNYAKQGIVIHIHSKTRISKNVFNDEKNLNFIEDTNNSGIISLLDYSFLKYYLKNPNLENIKCIIFDSVEERSLYTDILLLLLKQTPINKMKFKLIFITSETAVVENYFPLNKDIIFDFCKWIYPVNTIWKENNIDLSFNYVQDSIENVIGICQNTNNSSNILIFLTSILDIQQAASSLKRLLDLNGIKNFEIIQFHELQEDKEQKEMLSTNKEKRKIILSTDYGRNSKFIPPVQYVIDCGFILKDVYNSQSGSCEIWKQFQHKYSAEVRKSCAGRDGPGICYCLFSKDDYSEKMNDKVLSEVCYSDLSHLFILFLLHDINPLKFNYEENISPQYLNTFKEKLIRLEAINDDKLTEIGCKMSKLHFDPNIVKLIIRGYEERIPFEVSTLAALSMISGYISFRQDPNDQTKQCRFNQPNGDWETFYTIYTEWLNVPKKSKNYWCQLNKIDINTMKIYHELSNEIALAASKVCEKNKADKKNYEIKIQKLLLEIYPYNLCFYSREVNEGYQNAFNSNHLLLHSSSSLKHLGIFSEFIIYQTILKSSSDFILGINVIKEETLIEMEKVGKLPISINDLKTKILLPIKISNLSCLLLKSLIGRNKQNLSSLEKRLKNFIQNDNARIEVNLQKGEIVIYTNEQNISNAKNFIQEIFKDEKEKILNVENEIFIEGSFKNIRLIIGSGMEVKDILMPNECRDVFIKSNKPLNAILNMLDECGRICKYDVNKKGVIATFEKAAFAKNAINKYCNETNFKISYTMDLISPFVEPPEFVLKISWFRRPCLGLTFINFSSEDELHETLSKLATLELEIKGIKVMIQINKKNKNSLVLKGLPETTTLRDVSSAIKSLFPSEIPSKNIIVTRKKPYLSTDEEIEQLKQMLHDYFDKYTNLEELQIDIEKPKENSIIWNAIISFKNILDGFTAMASVKHIPCTGIQMKPDLSFLINCNFKIFYNVKSQIEEALKAFNTEENADDTLNVVAKPVGNLVSFRIQCNNLNDLIQVKATIQNILNGKCISDVKKSQINNLFSNCGTELIKMLEETFHLFIQIDCIKNTVTICGDPQTSKTAKNIIANFLNESKSYRQFELVGENIPKGALCAIAKSYGHDFAQLRISSNLEEIKFQFEERLLLACGNEVAFKKFENILDKLYKNIEKNKEKNDEFDEICPICFGVKNENFYRLSCCGCAFCKPCLFVQIKSGALPLVCQNNDCRKPFIWEDVKTILGKQKSMLQELQMKAFIKYFEENSDKYHCCPTIGCSYIYKKSQEFCMFHCPGCENDICTRCNIIYHHGMSCEMFWSINENEEAIQLWIQDDPSKRKSCPECKACLENSGENTLIGCWKCGKFICWICNKLFPEYERIKCHISSHYR